MLTVVRARHVIWQDPFSPLAAVHQGCLQREGNRGHPNAQGEGEGLYPMWMSASILVT